MSTTTSGPVAGEERLLIDGELRPARSGRVFETANPATGEVLGVAADGDASDMDDAIGAARRAFDTTDWSTNVARRVAGIRQLQQAFERNADAIRTMTVAETGSPLSFTYSAQLDTPVGSLGWVADLAESYEWETDLGNAEPLGIPSHRWVRREATGVVGAITPWNVPHQINLAKLGPALAAGNTVVLKPAPDTPWCATVLGRRGQRRPVVGPRARRHPVHRPPGRPGQLHRVDGHRPEGHGDSGGDDQEGLPRARWQIGVRDPGRRRPARRLRHRGVHRLHARRAGVRHHHPPHRAPLAVRRGR